MNTQNLSTKVSEISLDFPAEVSDNELQFESAYAKMLFSKDRKIHGNYAEDNKYDARKIRKKRSIEKEAKSPTQILKQNIQEPNFALKTIINTENTGGNYIYDRKNDFIAKNTNHPRNLKQTEELQSMPQQV